MAGKMVSVDHSLIEYANSEARRTIKNIEYATTGLNKKLRRLRLYTKQIVITVQDDTRIGEEAKELRKSYGKKLKDISHLSGKSIGYISDLEHGRKKWSKDILKWYEDACIGIKAK